MSDLFDLPFEEEDSPRATGDSVAQDSPVAPDSSPTPRRSGTAAGPNPVAARRILTVTELTVRIRDLLECRAQSSKNVAVPLKSIPATSKSTANIACIIF